MAESGPFRVQQNRLCFINNQENFQTEGNEALTFFQRGGFAFGEQHAATFSSVNVTEKSFKTSLSLKFVT